LAPAHTPTQWPLMRDWATVSVVIVDVQKS
jgi:hypothetical protein